MKDNPKLIANIASKSGGTGEQTFFVLKKKKVGLIWKAMAAFRDSTFNGRIYKEHMGGSTTDDAPGGQRTQKTQNKMHQMYLIGLASTRSCCNIVAEGQRPQLCAPLRPL